MAVDVSRFPFSAFVQASRRDEVEGGASEA
jgi:hypothetical protein